MFIILGHQHSLLHVWTLLAKKETKKNNNFVQYAMNLHSITNNLTTLGRKDDITGTVMGRSQDQFAQEEMSKKVLPGYPRRFIRDEKFRKNIFDTGRTEEMCRQMDGLAGENHTHHWTPKEIRDYKVSGWIRSNKIGWDTMHVRHRSDFKQALSTLRQLKKKRWSSTKPKMDAKLFFVLVELAKIMVAFFLRESPRRRAQRRLIRETW